MKFVAEKYSKPLPPASHLKKSNICYFGYFENAKILAADIDVIYLTGLQRIVFQYLESVIIGERWMAAVFV